MYLIIGLGNPDKKYDRTRHNIGFTAVDFLVETFGLEKFKLQDKFKSAISLGQINEQRVIIAKPQTYMNNSGRAVQLLKNYYKIQNEDLIIIYDELDLPLGKIRLRQDGSSAGHNGIKSIIDYLTTDKFYRIRIGIRNKDADKIPANKFVLSRFSFFEKRKLAKKILPQAMDELVKLIK